MSDKNSDTSNRYVMPGPVDLPFRGVVGRTTDESITDFPQPVQAPQGAPNVLLIMTDDVGFGASSTFGGPIPTPSFDRVANNGLKFNRFNTTALCSPTRAALITGRNPHNVNTGIIMERSMGYPGLNTVMTKSAGTVAEVLRQNGYNTAWIGKNHNIPGWLSSQSGAFDLWPTGLGFEYFYGFIGGDNNQWAPSVIEGTTPIEPQLEKEDYHFDTDMADQAVHWIQQQNSLAPDKPFFLYYVPGATHAPHHVPQDWIARFKGQFDHGWDEQRRITYERQLELGIIPAGTQLTPRPENMPAWDSLSDDQKKLYCRMMEIYAAFLHFTDYNIGRILDAVEETGQLDNTLIIYIMGDNGGSAEGTLQGTANELAILGNGEGESLDYLLSVMDELGGPLHYNHFPVPWSWSMNSPFQWTKRYASHFGGIRNGMAMSWPQGIKDHGGLRDQYHHVIDIVPTIYEVVGITPPSMLNGVAQKPIDGVSMAYTWDDETADGRRVIQYAEMFGNRSLYQNGWMASSTPLVFAWEPEPKGVTPESFEWELYNLDEDFSQANNLAQQYPEKLRQLQDMWWAEAGKFQVLPLNFSPQATVAAVIERPSLTAGRTHFEYFKGTSKIPEGTAPALLNKSYKITARIEVPEAGTEGVLVTQGGRFGGWGLYVLDGKPMWTYKRSQQPSHAFHIESADALTAGKHEVVLNFDYDYGEGKSVGRGGKYTLRVDKKIVAEGTFDRTIPYVVSVDETLDIGCDTGTPIDERYAERLPFEFTGTLERIIIDLEPHHLNADGVRRVHDGLEEAYRATE